MNQHSYSTKLVMFLTLPLILMLAVLVATNQAIVIYAGSHEAEPQDATLLLPQISREGEIAAASTPSWGAPIAISPSDHSVWVVNPDSASISQLDPLRLVKITEIETGGEPWSIAFAPDGSALYVVDRARGQLLIVSVATHTVTTAIPLGPEPAAIALTPDGKRAYVSVSAASKVAVVDLEGLKLITLIAVDALPYAVAVTNDGDNDSSDEYVYVTHLLALPRNGQVEGTDEGREGRVSLIATQSNSVTGEIALAPDEHGFPNVLAGIALSGNWAWIPYVRAAPDLPNGLTTTVFAAVSVLDHFQSEEDSAARLSLNDEDRFGSPVNNPVAAIPSPDGQSLYVVLAGSNLVEVIDISDPYNPRLVKFLPAGQNPRGMALSSDGRLGYVMSYLARSITVLDLEQELWVAEVPVTSESLDATVLRGKILFNSATDPRLSRASWISCASCHPNEGSDNVTWHFPDGPRQTPALWNSGRTLPWHWSATLDEPQDVEVTIQDIQQGVGLAPGADLLLLDKPFSGQSADLDALAAFLVNGIRAPQISVATTGKGNETEQGRELFRSSGCATCHGGSEWTTSALPALAGTLDADSNGMVDAVLQDVGTNTPNDLRGATGFDVPSLLGVGLTAPYFHDGSMPTLDALIHSGHPSPNRVPVQLRDNEIDALVAFLQAIDADTAPILTE